MAVADPMAYQLIKKTFFSQLIKNMYIANFF